MGEATQGTPPELITCPGCEGWGHIREGKTGTIPCAVCKGEGEVEMRVDDAPPVVLGLILAVVVVILVAVVLFMAEALDAAP